jgi:hypothetical protein
MFSNRQKTEHQTKETNEPRHPSFSKRLLVFHKSEYGTSDGASSYKKRDKRLHFLLPINLKLLVGSTNMERSRGTSSKRSKRTKFINRTKGSRTLRTNGENGAWITLRREGKLQRLNKKNVFAGPGMLTASERICPITDIHANHLTGEIRYPSDQQEGYLLSPSRLRFGPRSKILKGRGPSRADLGWLSFSYLVLIPEKDAAYPSVSSPHTDTARKRIYCSNALIWLEGHTYEKRKKSSRERGKVTMPGLNSNLIPSAPSVPSDDFIGITMGASDASLLLKNRDTCLNRTDKRGNYLKGIDCCSLHLVVIVRHRSFDSFLFQVNFSADL